MSRITIESVLADGNTSVWLKNAIQGLLGRDLVVAINDTDLLLAMLWQHLNDALGHAHANTLNPIRYDYKAEEASDLSISLDEPNKRKLDIVFQLNNKT
jgi:hypothetical protein